MTTIFGLRQMYWKMKLKKDGYLFPYTCKIRTAQTVKMAAFWASKWPKLISCKIWVAEKSWNFQIQYSQLGCPGLYFMITLHLRVRRTFIPDFGSRAICNRSIQYEGNWRSNAGSGISGSQRLPRIKWVLGWHPSRYIWSQAETEVDDNDVKDVFPVMLIHAHEYARKHLLKSFWNCQKIDFT